VAVGRRWMLPGLGGGLVIALADQATKWWIVGSLMQPPRVVELTPFLNIVLVHNRGVTFGLLDSQSVWAPWLLAGLAIAIVAALVVWLARAADGFQAVALTALIGGAAGNVVDRVRLGAVVDFVDLHLAGWHWPAFNLADSAIVAGVALLLYDALFRGRQSGTS